MMFSKLRLLTAISLGMGMIVALLGLMMNHRPPAVQAAESPQAKGIETLMSVTAFGVTEFGLFDPGVEEDQPAAIGLFDLQAVELPLSPTQTIDNSVPGTGFVAVADVDHDGDPDVVGIAKTAGSVLWWENANADGSSWITHTIATGINNVADVAAADIDRDGDVDVTAVSSSDDSLLWWENADQSGPGSGDGTTWVTYTMSTSLDGAATVHTADIDRNGAIDLLVTAENDNDIIWYQNPLTVTRIMIDSNNVTYITATVYTPALWISHTLVNDFSGANAAATIDLDGDGDLDVLGGSTSNSQLIRLRNDGRGTTWYQYPTAWTVAGISDMAAADLDGDGDEDAFAAANTDNDIIAWLNDGSGSSWTSRTVDSDFTGVTSVVAADMDLDGDQDILAAGDDGTSWFENTAADATAWTERIVAEADATDILVADLDKDDDYDLVGASDANNNITWWQNEAIHANIRFLSTYTDIYTETQIELTDLAVGDIDGDGDNDFLTSSRNYVDWLRWWENDDGAWIRHEISTTYANFFGLELGDIDNDGDIDAVGISSTSGTPGDPGEVIFWENLDGSGTTWQEHVLPKDDVVDGKQSYDGLLSLTLADMNNNGQLDIALGSDTSVHWFERWTWHKSGGTPVEWKAHIIGPDSSAATGGFALDQIPSLEASDIDNDGDTDLVVGAFLTYGINGGIAFWYENTAPCNGSPNIDPHEYVPHVCRWTRHELARNLNFRYPYSTWPNDVNRDGKQDVLGYNKWWDNGGRCTTDNDVLPNFWKLCSWTSTNVPPGKWWWPSATDDVQIRRSVEFDIPGAPVDVIELVDIDNDGDLDRLMGGDGGGIIWIENQGGQFELPTTDTSPTEMNAGSQDDLFQIDLTHLGWSGDADVAWTTIDLLLEDVTGNDPLTTAEANAIIANLYLYLDDGDGLFNSGSDTLVHTETDLSLTNGLHTITLTDDDPNSMVSQAVVSKTYFLAVELEGALIGNPARNGITDIRLTHQTENSSQAEQAGTDVPLRMAYTPNTSAQIELLGPTIDLGISKVATPTLATPGDTITYTLTFSNAGISTASGIIITDVIAGGQFSSLGYQAAGAAITETGSVSYVWQVADLGPGAGGVITLSGVLSASLPLGSYTNVATISDIGDLIMGNNSSSAGVLVYCSPSLVVSNLGDGDDGNYCPGQNTLREAIAYANPGDTVTFDAGLLGGTITLGGMQLALTKTLSIEANVPITVSGNNASRVFNISSGVAITLTGLTIRDGSIAGNGGGILSWGDLRLEATRLLSNSANNGGGLYVRSGSAVLSGTQVSNNSVITNGGGLYIYAGSAVLSDTQVFSNSAFTKGGGLYIRDAGATLTMVGGQVQNNSATDHGGGVYLEYGAAVLSATLVSGNSASSYGGGLYIDRGSVRLTMVGGQVQNNSASTRGSGLYIYRGRAVLSGTQVFSNSGTTNGGGLYIARGSAELNDTRVFGNAAKYGGGVYVGQNGSELTMVGGQVHNNSATNNGGGLYFSYGSAVLSGTQVLSNSTTNDGGGLYLENGIATLIMYGGQVRGNSVTNDGGGLYVRQGSIVLTGTQVLSNSANKGDAIYNYRGTITSGSALTLNGEVHQAGGDFAASSYDLNIQGDLVLAGGNFYAPDAPNQFTLTDAFSHTAGSYHQTQIVTGSQDIGFPKAGGLILNANGLDLADTAVILTAGADCAGVTPGEAVRHCYVISPTQTSGRNVTLTFFYQDSELLANHNCSVMEAYAWDGSWNNRLARDTTYGSEGRLCGSGPQSGTQSLQVMGVSTFPEPDSSFILRGAFADLSISKAVTPTQVSPGEAVTYTLTFSNAGVFTATGVIITDVMPISVTSHLTPHASLNITPIGSISYVWQVEDLSPGEVGVITLSGTLSDSLPLGSYTNVATISGEVELITSNNSSSVDLLVYCQPSLVVDNLGDGDDGNYCPGENTLREAIAHADAGDTVTYDAGLSNGTITLDGTQLELTKTLSIEAGIPITVSGNNASRVFYIGSSVAITLTGLTIRDGSVTGSGGGGIYTDGDLRLEATRLISNSAKYGGGLYVNQGSTVLSSTQVVSNSTSDDGGGLYVNSSSAALTMNGGQVYDNSASLNGGGLYVSAGSAVLSGMQVHGNSANDGDAVYNNGGTITSSTALTLSGEVYQAGGTFAVGSYDLDLDGDLALAGGDFYAPDAPRQFTLSGAFTHTAGSYHQTQIVTGSQDIGFPKAGGLILNANGLDLDSTAVTITAGEDCAGVTPGEAVRHCYVISPTQTSGRNATLTFFYQDIELSTNHNCSAMEAYAWDGSWDNQLTRDTSYDGDGRLCGTEPQSIQVLNVSSFPTFTLRGAFVDLALSKAVTYTMSVPGEAAPGEIITYTLTFTNNGPGAVSGVVITDFLPAEITVLNVISSGDAAITRTLSNQTFEVFETSAVSPGQGGLITITAQISSSFIILPSSFTNTATITFGNAVAMWEESDTTTNSAAVGLTIPQFGLNGSASAGLTDVNAGSVAWGDYDNDGDLDILLTGEDDLTLPHKRYAQVYENTVPGFTVAYTLTRVAYSSAAWGDYDNDGDLDILLTGWKKKTDNVAQVYENTAPGFTLAYTLTGVNSSSVDWGDYDNDGDLDILLTGWTGSDDVAQVYENTPPGFTVAYTLPSVSDSSAAWGDYDNDGDLDILLTGYRGIDNVAEVYESTGSGFTLAYTLTGVAYGSAAWGDYDNDGDLDILLTGEDAGVAPLAEVYQNTGSGFTVVYTPTGVYDGSAAWGDYDNDGDLDIFLTGEDNGNTPVGEVYQNTGGSFTRIESGLPGVYHSSAVWGDYDNDDDLDILLIGYRDDGFYDGLFTAVYRNNNGLANSRPAAPTGLSASVNGSQVDLSWAAATDTETISNAGLTYNLYLGSSPGQSDILGPMAFTAGTDEGLRLLPDLGNAQHGLTATLTILQPGVYYWSVQAIDTAFAGSSWATEATFEIEAVSDLGLSKVVASTHVNPGDTITYTLTFSNTGNSSASGVVITDFLPAEITVQNVISSGDVAITRTLSSPTFEVFETSAVSPGQSGLITITAQASSFILHPSSFTNTATISTTSAEIVTANNRATAGLTVNNVAPVLAAIGNQAITETETLTFTASASDTNGDALSYSLINAPGTATIDSGTGFFTWTPTEADGPGVYTTTISISDGNLLVSETIRITVNEAIIIGLSATNDSPTVLGDSTGFTATVTIGSSVIYDWDFGDGSGDSGGTTNHTYTTANTYTVVVTASNSLGSLTTTLTVMVTNAAPLAMAGSDQIVITNTLVTLDGSGSSDPDGHTPLSYGWHQTGGPTITLSDSGAVSPTFSVPNSITVLTFTLTVTDTGGLSATDTVVIITVGMPDLSIAKTVSPATAAPGDTITYTLTFSNAGASIATGVVITDSLPAEITVLNIISSGDMAITRTLSNPTFEVFETSAVSPGQSGLITITAQASSFILHQHGHHHHHLVG